MLIYLQSEGLQVRLKFNSQITISVMCQEISVNQEIMMKEAVEQCALIVVPVTATVLIVVPVTATVLTLKQ